MAFLVAVEARHVRLVRLFVRVALLPVPWSALAVLGRRPLRERLPVLIRSSLFLADLAEELLGRERRRLLTAAPDPCC